MWETRFSRGFTLIEMMLVVALLSILAGVAIVAINPNRQLAETRDNTRRVDVATIWNAVQQFMLNNPGDVPGAIPDGELEDCLDDPLSSEFTICKTESCDLILSELTENSAYLVEIPSDPSVDHEDYSGYNIVRDINRNNRVTVCAPAAETGEAIYLPK